MKTYFVLSILLMFFVTSGCTSNNINGKEDTIQNMENIAAPPQSESIPTTISSEKNVYNQNIILTSNYLNEERNRLLIADIDYLGKQLSILHPNPFEKISQQEFKQKIDSLKLKVNELDNIQVLTEMQRIVASIGDSHTHFMYGTNIYYPITFGSFSNDFYVLNANKGNEDLLYAKVLSINKKDITYIQEEIKPLISTENDYYAKVNIAKALSIPTIIEGLGLIQDHTSPIEFTFMNIEGVVFSKEITPLQLFSNEMDFCLSTNDTENIYLFHKTLSPLYEKTILGQDYDYYWYKYLDKEKIVYFQYNMCTDNDKLPFQTFNNGMFENLKEKTVDKFVVDLRNNMGGNSSIINPFILSLSEYIEENPSVKVFVIISNNTYSAGIQATLDIKDASNATLTGEPTGGSPDSYADSRYFELPNLKMKVYYSTKEFILHISNEKNEGDNTILPDIEIIPSLDDCKHNKDIVMDYIINLK